MQHESFVRLFGGVLGMGIALGVAPFVDRLEAAAEKPSSPGGGGLISIPFLSSPPKIDGALAPGEWREASAVTGFTELDTKRLAARQTVVYAGYDRDRLYFAFHCPGEDNLGVGMPGRDSPWNNQIDAVEIWLQPPGKSVYHFLGWPAGGFIDGISGGGIAWNGNWEYKCSVEDSGETVGGVQTFGKSIWRAEVSIPFADLGSAAPNEGDAWKINFCRDLSVADGKTRGTGDWTTWSPIQGRFDAIDQFAVARFSRKAAAIQLQKIGRIQDGDLLVKGQAGGQGLRICMKTVLAKGGKTISFQKTQIDSPGDKPAEFTLSDGVNLVEPTEMLFELSAIHIASDEPLLRMSLPFTSSPPFQAKVVPIFSQGFLNVELDAKRLGSLPSQVLAIARLHAEEGGEEILSQTQACPSKELGRTDLKFDIGKLREGKYRVNVELQDRNEKRRIAQTVARFEIPLMPDLVKDRVRSPTGVPEPWKPVEVRKETVCVTQREYRLDHTGLPRQVTALDEPLFAEAPSIRFIIGGKAQTWKSEALEMIAQDETQATWKLRAKSGALCLEGRLRVEFDGFALWNVDISGEQPVKIESLWLEFPFRSERALYARGWNAIEDNGGYYAALFTGKAATDESIAFARFSEGGWAWPEKWMTEIWIGDDQRGFSLMHWSDEFLRGRKRISIDRNGETALMKVFLIDGGYELRRMPLHYEFAWQATPVKPLSANPKLWHVGYGRIRDPGFLKRACVVSDTVALKNIDYPALADSRLPNRNDLFVKAGVKPWPYLCGHYVTTEIGELTPLLSEWSIHPIQTLTFPRFGGSRLVCLNSSFREYLLNCCKTLVDKLHFSALYFDVANVAGCSNRHHGCGYLDEASGTWKPTADLLGAREFFKRLYQVSKEGGRDIVLYYHLMPYAGVAGFVDVVTEGEGWGSEGNRQYDRISPSLFRTKEMKTQYGPAYTWYVFHHMYRGEKYGGRVPLAAILCYCLPHGVLPTEDGPGMWPVWDVMDQWVTTAEFIPYWSPSVPLFIKESGVLGSVYLKRKEQRALFIIANWNQEPQSLSARIDFKKLGASPGSVRLSRALQHPILAPEDNRKGDAMENAPLVEKAGILTMVVDGRNLEVIEADWSAQ